MLQVMHQQAPEEEVAQSLQTWKPDNTVPSSDITISSTDTQEVDNNGISEKSVYFDKNEGNVLKLDDADIGELVNAAIKSQITLKNAKGKEIVSTEKDANITGTASGVMHESVRISDLAEEEDSDGDDDDEEVILLEFERAAEKVHTHTPYCPNCSSRITKVILRRTKKAKKRPASLLLKCLSCFSIFLPSGNGLSPLIFGKRPKQESQRVAETTPPGELAIDIPGETGTGATDEQALVLNTNDGFNKPVEILKCIVYGGLMENITSLSVVSSAAASDPTTLNIIAIGFATVISSVFIFAYNLMDLRNENNVVETSDRLKDKYQELLGTRGHFLFHSTFAVLSFILFGLMPPIIYGFAFHVSDDKDYKILAVAAASFACILVLAITKAYCERLTKWSEYVKTVFYYFTMAAGVSGGSYAAGDLFKIVMQRLGWFEPDSAITPTRASY